MKRTLLALLLALTLLLTCAVAVSAETVTILYKGGTVAANTPFQVYLGSKPVGTVQIHCYKAGLKTDETWVQSTQSGEDLEIKGNYLTVKGKYVSASDVDSMVGMMLTGVEYDALIIPYAEGKYTIYIKFGLNSDGEYVYETVYGDGELARNFSEARIDHTNNLLYVQFNGRDNENVISFNPDTVRATILTFENNPKLHTDPLEPGVYYHYFEEKSGYVIRYVYAVVCDTEGVYKSFDGSDVGLNLTYSYSDSVAKLTVEKNGVLDGATFTGDDYLADMVTFTSQTDSFKTIERLVYKDEEGYKCIDDNGVIKTVLVDSADTGKLWYDDEYYASSYFRPYPLMNRVLFFKSDKSFGSGNNPDNPDTPDTSDTPDTPVTPAPSYPKYYPDYDEPTTVQPAPEAPAAEKNEYVVMCRRLNVRRTPSTRYARIGRIVRGDVVKVVEWVGKWAKIEWKGGTAYVHGNYIAPVD